MARNADGKVSRTFRLPPDLADELNARAKEEHTTATQIAQDAISAYLHPESEPVTKKDLGMLFTAIDDVKNSLPAPDERAKRVRHFLGYTITKE